MRGVIPNALVLAVLTTGAVAAASAAAPPFDSHSCWVRTGLHERGLEMAPSVVAPAPRRRVSPQQLADRVVARFGDRRFVRAARVGRPPRNVRIHWRGWFGKAPEPPHPVWVYLDAPPLPAKQPVRYALESWEIALVAGALHDDACDARTDPIVGVSIRGARVESAFMQSGPFGQRFPNPKPSVFRKRVERAAADAHVAVRSLRFLHPRQLAPIVAFRARNRLAFIKAIAGIENTLGFKAYPPYEGMFLLGVDSNGIPFVFTTLNYRGEVAGGQWSSDHCHYPFLHGGIALAHGRQRPGCTG